MVIAMIIQYDTYRIVSYRNGTEQNANNENKIMRKQYDIYRIGKEQNDNIEKSTMKIVYNMNSSEFVISIIQYIKE